MSMNEATPINFNILFLLTVNKINPGISTGVQNNIRIEGVINFQKYNVY